MRYVVPSRSRRAFCLFVAITAVLAGCRDQRLLPTEATPTPQFSRASAPPNGGYWSVVSDSALWKELTRTDTTLNIGFKIPGTAHGVLRGRAQVDRASWLSSIRAVGQQPGIKITHADSTRFPLVTVKIRDFESLVLIRRLPFVD